MITIPDNVTLYVYYKIPVDQSALYLSAVKQLHQEMALRYPEIIIQRQKRPGPDTTNQETWMEIYAGIAQTSLEQLIADLSELAKACGLPYERRNEVFINL